MKMGAFIKQIQYIISEYAAYYKPLIATNKYRLQGIVVGRNTTIRNCSIGRLCRFGYDNNISHSSIGDYTYTASNTKIHLSEVGKFCSISWNVNIGAQDHPLTRISTHSFSYLGKYQFIDENISSNIPLKRTKIGNDVWIACDCIIKSGIQIGNGAVIGSGAVVTKDVPAYAIVAGNPARIIKYRFDEEMIQMLETSKWWDLPVEYLKSNIELFRKDNVEVKDIEKLLSNKKNRDR